MQVPASVEYARADSVDHAIELLRRYGPEARVIAGGHSLIPMMKLRLAQPEMLIDINGIEELANISVEDNELRIGAMVRHADLLASPLVAEHFPILAEAERVIADPIVRNRGTVGGSLCQADPSEDLSAAFSALKATVMVRGRDGVRSVAISEFHTGPYSTAVLPDEVMVEVRVPIRPGVGSAYEKVERRVGDWAVASVGSAVWMREGSIYDVGIGLTAVGASHFCAPQAQASLIGAPPTGDAISYAAQVASQECNPTSDQRGPEDYKRHLVAELTRRTLTLAVARSQGEVA